METTGVNDFLSSNLTFAKWLLAAMCLLAGLGLAGADTPSDETPELKHNLKGRSAVQALGSRLSAMAAAHGMTAERFEAILQHDATAWLDTSGRLYYVEPQAPESAARLALPSRAGFRQASSDAAETFALHSRRGASRVIYLDFDGHTVTGSAWNRSFALPVIDAPAFDSGGDNTTFDEDELARIREIWSRVAEDYAPFDVDVTTEEPSAEALERTTLADQQYGTRVVITTSVLHCGCGGIAYVGVFDLAGSYYKPAWVFYDRLGAGDEKYMAEAISHEAGHNLGLSHDGTASVSYYQGHGTGETGWAPIMGVGYYKELVQWSQGEYYGANNREDDISILQSHGADLRVDDTGDSPESAAALSGLAGAHTFMVEQAGIIERRTDVDVYVFATSGGIVSFNVAPAAVAPNLDVAASLHGIDGTVIAATDVAATLNTTISAELAAGTYYLRVDGAGKSAAGSDSGYSDYGSLGHYRITGQYPRSIARPPSATAGASPAFGVAPLPAGFSSDSSNDDGAIVSFRWDFGDGTVSSEPNPLHVYTEAGTYSATLTLTNDAGLTGTAAVLVTVASANDASAVHIDRMTMALSTAKKRLKAKVQVLVTNAIGQAVPGVAVKGKWRGLAAGNASALTDATGVATIQSSDRPRKKGTFTFAVTRINRDGYTYQPAKDIQRTVSLTR